jgi:hypothetical protein
VLAKLGFDLTSELEDTFTSPLPPRIQRLANEVDGYVEWHDVGPSPAPPSGPDARRTWRQFVEADQPFRFN